MWALIQFALTRKHSHAKIAPIWLRKSEYADVVELADTLDLGSSAARHAGSSPVIRTIAIAAGDTKHITCGHYLSIYFRLGCSAKNISNAYIIEFCQTHKGFCCILTNILVHIK